MISNRFRIHVRSRVLLLGILVLRCLLSSVPAEARSLYPPPFIQDRPLGKSLAAQMDAAAKSGKSPIAIHRECRKILSEGLSKNGQRFRSEFPRGFRLDFSDPAYRKIATNLLRGNQSNWHGYLRELKYLNEIARKQSPFSILSVGDRAKLRGGQLVEFDALLEDKRTGLKISGEFKDWKITSRASLEKAKRQIDKISRRARQQGVSRSMWVNRARVSDTYRKELEDYALRRNVGLYAHISTSDKLAHRLKNPQRFDDVLEKEARVLKKIKGGRLVGRGAGIAGTLYGGYQVGSAAYLWNSGAMTTRKATITASEGVGKAAGGLAGAYLGAQAGGTIGVFFPPAAPFLVAGGGIVGGVVGAVGGSVAGSAAGELLVDQVIYKDLEEKETDALIAFLQDYYQSPSSSGSTRPVTRDP